MSPLAYPTEPPYIPASFGEKDGDGCFLLASLVNLKASKRISAERRRLNSTLRIYTLDFFLTSLAMTMSQIIIKGWKLIDREILHTQQV